MNKKYNVAIIGSGSIANKFHIPAFKKNKNVNEIILYDVNKKNLLKSSKINKIKSVYTNFERMISEKKIDILNICTPPSMHFHYIIKAIKNNINILVEKPFVINLKELRSIKKNLKKSKVHCYCAYHQRSRPISNKIKQIIEQNKIGQIYYIKIIHRQFRSIPKHSKYFSIKKFSGGGPLIDLGSHYFDLIGWFLNFPKIKKLSNFCFSNISKLDTNKKYLPFKKYNNEELSTGYIQFVNDCVINYELSYVLNTKDEIKSIEFFGTNGSLKWPEGKISLVKKNKIIEKKIKVEKYLASEKQVNRFIKNLSSKFSLNYLKQISFTVELIEKLYKFRNK